MRKKNTSAKFIKDCYSDALIRLIENQDYYSISISDICRASGFGRTSYYRYFTNNKDDLLLYHIHSGWEEYKTKHAEAVKNDEGGELLRFLFADKKFLLMLVSKNLNHIIFNIVYNEIKVKEHENQIMAYGKSFFAGAYFGIIYEWIQQGCKDTPDEISQKFMAGCLYAIEQAKINEEKVT